MSKGNQPKTLSCNHAPAQPKVSFFGFSYKNRVLGKPKFNVDMKWKVSLVNPNIAIATDEKGKKHRGTWTSIYDEGFQVEVASKTFFAFSSFSKPRFTMGGHYKHGSAISNCKATWPGWHRDSKNPDKATWGCYTGAKKGNEVLAEHMSMLDDEELLQHTELIQEPATPAIPKSIQRSEQSSMYKPEHELVARINKKATTWKAKVYPQFEKLTMKQLNSMAGFRRAQIKPIRKPHAGDAFVQEFAKEVADLPENFDWRNHKGQNFVDPVIYQECGSCYAVSTTSMINSRIRIQTNNKEKPEIPYKQILKCDKYNQGCAGGYPFLAQKYTQEFGLTKSGKCAKSHDQLRELGESKKSEHTPYVRVSKFGYVGGYYGGTRTGQIMRELHKNGPVVVGLNGGYDLLHYESGIFYETGEGDVDTEHESTEIPASKDEFLEIHSRGDTLASSEELIQNQRRHRGHGFHRSLKDEEKLGDDDFNQDDDGDDDESRRQAKQHRQEKARRARRNAVRKQKGIRNDFERVDHAVLLVGWATDPKTKEKHWIVKNSHGSDWGEKGYFRLALGGDTFGVECLATAATPVLGGANYFNTLAESTH